MSDHEAMELTNGETAEDPTKHHNEDDDDDEDSSSSGSESSSSGSLSSDSSDSEDGSDNDNSKHEDSAESAGSSLAPRKNSTEFGIGRRIEREEAKGEALNVNSNRAAARFREQNSQVGLMALGTKKRDRRTIEEIQRDLQRKRGSRQLPTSSSSNSRTPPFNGAISSVRKPSSAASSPIKTSPALSPDNNESAALSVGLPEFKIPKGKPNSARSRLAKKVFGRGGSSKPTRPTPAGTKAKTATTTGGVSIVTNISAGTVIKTTPNAPSTTAGTVSSLVQPSSATSISSSAHQANTGTSVPSGSPLNEYLSDPPPLITPHVNSSASGNSSKFTADQVKLVQQQKQLMENSKPDAKITRSLLRAMLRYGDLTDVGLHESNRKSFADEFRPSSFIVRANLVALTKMSEDRLLRVATELASQCESMLHREQKLGDERTDSMKYGEVELKPSQVIERLYENLKLRVAVQRAFRAANLAKPSAPPGSLAPSLATKASTLTNHAYVLVAQQSESSSLGISRDCPNWIWAERDYEWTTKKDAALLLGIYVHGFGAWEDVLNDDLLHFQKQRALKGERLKKRAETLLKKLPAPDDKSELLFGGVVSSPSSISSVGIGGIAGGMPSQEKKGRMQRAAERFAARQAIGSTHDDQRRRTMAEDSIHRSNPQLEEEKQRNVNSISSMNASSSEAKENGQREPEAGDDSKRLAGHKRAAAGEYGGSSVKKVKRDRESSSAKAKKSLTVLSQAELVEKWKPTKRLKEIRQILKKMKIMNKWSQAQKEQVILEKMYKYISTIGDAIDRIVGDAKEEDRDELCTCLWTYAADFTTFSPSRFEQLYDDMCLDAAALQTNGVS